MEQATLYKNLAAKKTKKSSKRVQLPGAKMNSPSKSANKVLANFIKFTKLKSYKLLSFIYYMCNEQCKFVALFTII